MRHQYKSRHSCRDLRLAALAVAALTGCTTIVPVPKAANAGLEPLIDEVAAHPRAYAWVTGPVSPLQPLADTHGPYRIVSHRPGWLTLSDRVNTTAVPLSQIASASTYGRVRGAVEGAVPAGVVAFGLFFAIRAFLMPRGCGADGPCDPSIPVAEAAKVGALFGAVAALIGGAVGAAVGHETRYQLVPAGESEPR